jgi:hypothetical protein
MTPREVGELRLDQLHAFERAMREELEARAEALRRANRRRRR